MDLLLSVPEFDDELRSEIARNYAGTSVQAAAPGVLLAHLPRTTTAPFPLVFARQCLPNAQFLACPSVRAAAEFLVSAIIGVIPDGSPWRLHVVPCYGIGTAGLNRCRLIQEAVIEQLQKRRRHLRRSLLESTKPFSETESLVQLVLVTPESGYLSAAVAPLPSLSYRVVSPFLKGEIPIASDKAAPSRAFAKLVETELRLGQTITPGETCVDLGATPGSWTYVAVQRGAQVTSVDRSPLRDDLMRNPAVEFVQGDAFTFRPRQPVDWLLCDVIAAPERSIDLLIEWLKAGLCRRFVVTIKFKGSADYPKLDGLKAALEGLAGRWSIAHLCANKNEACAFGVARNR
ncbi:MAG TPA: SAM-dependent methyltransferase [Candidatus Limnocylindria bacterium]|nr:SAM-dependent methyltransferase [Candidatus Limnocylindria bacterium]